MKEKSIKGVENINKKQKSTFWIKNVCSLTVLKKFDLKFSLNCLINRQKYKEQERMRMTKRIKEKESERTNNRQK